MSDAYLVEECSRQRQLLDRAEHPALLWRDGIILHANPALARQMGVATPDALIGRSVTEFLPPEMEPVWSERIRRLGDPSVQLGTQEYRIRRDDGTDFVAEVFSRPTLFGGESVIETIVIDVSSHVASAEAARQALEEIEAQLRARTEEFQRAMQISEERWRFALEGSGDGVWDWDPVTNQTFFSARWKEMIGYEEDEIPNTFDAWASRLHPADLDATLAALQRHFHQEVPAYAAEFRMRCKDGSYKWIQARGKVLSWSEDRRPLRVVGTHSDISVRKAAEAEIARLHQDLAERAAELESANRELEAFTYSVSHDLRGPLRAVDAMAYLLLEDYGATIGAEGTEMIDRIRSAAKGMNQLIDDLLRLSRVARTPLHRESIDLTAMTEEIVQQLRVRSRDRTCVFEIEPELRIEGDSGLTRILLENLLDNAWKFTHGRPGRIQVMRGSSPESIVVGDNGVGFDMRYASKLFEPFLEVVRAVSALPRQAGVRGFGNWPGDGQTHRRSPRGLGPGYERAGTGYVVRVRPRPPLRTRRGPGSLREPGPRRMPTYLESVFDVDWFGFSSSPRFVTSAAYSSQRLLIDL